MIRRPQISFSSRQARASGAARRQPCRQPCRQPRARFGSGWTTLLLLGLVALVAVSQGRQAGASDQLSVNETIARQRARIAANPSADLYNDLGSLYLFAGQSLAAIQAYERALELDYGSFDAHFNLGLLASANGQHRVALRYLEEALQRRPDSAWAHYQIGEAQRALGRRKQAVSAYTRAFGLDSRLALLDVNPHVAGNPYATEALLRSQEVRSVPAAAPSSYANPTLIASELVAISEAATGEGPTEQTSSQKTGPNDGQGTAQSFGTDQSTSETGLPPMNAPPGSDGDTVTATDSTTSSARARSERDDERSERLPRGRILGPRRVVGPGSGDERQGGRARSPQDDSAGSDGESRRFRPGQRSTASLELRLVEPEALLIADASRAR